MLVNISLRYKLANGHLSHTAFSSPSTSASCLLPFTKSLSLQEIKTTSQLATYMLKIARFDKDLDHAITQLTCLFFKQEMCHFNDSNDPPAYNCSIKTSSHYTTLQWNGHCILGSVLPKTIGICLKKYKQGRALFTKRMIMGAVSTDKVVYTQFQSKLS